MGTSHSQILPTLYLGSRHSIDNATFFKDNNITHVVSICDEHPPAEFGLVNLHINKMDTPKANLREDFERVIKFIHTARLTGKTVFVHCQAGYSRSSTIVIAYMMATQNMTYEEGFGYVAICRRIGPNMGFVKQLEKFREVGCAQLRQELEAMDEHSSLEKQDAEHMVKFRKEAADPETPYIVRTVDDKGTHNKLEVKGTMLGKELWGKLLELYEFDAKTFDGFIRFGGFPGRDLDLEKPLSLQSMTKHTLVKVYTGRTGLKCSKKYVPKKTDGKAERWRKGELRIGKATGKAPDATSNEHSVGKLVEMRVLDGVGQGAWLPARVLEKRPEGFTVEVQENSNKWSGLQFAEVQAENLR